MLDIEGSILTHVVLIGIKRTARIQSVGVGVDVEATRDCPIDRIGRLRECTWSTLDTRSSVDQGRDGDLRGEVVGSVEVTRVASYVARAHPSWVKHRREGDVGLEVLRPSGEAQGVVLHDSWGEELLEPVCVAELTLAQVLGLGLWGIS